MTLQKLSYTFLAQAETLLIYGIFLFLTGLAQICVTVTHRYILERTIQNNFHINILTLFPSEFTRTDIHAWFVYLSAASTIIPFLCCILYTFFKRHAMAVLICISSIICFISSTIYIGLLIVHTLEYWQTMSSPSSNPKSPQMTTTLSSRSVLPYDDQVTFINLALLITFTLALVQALLALIGSVIACLWSPCCVHTLTSYTPIPTTSHYAQTTPHRYDTPQSSTIRSLKRPPPPPSETHRFLTTTTGLVHKNSPLRGHYDEV